MSIIDGIDFAIQPYEPKKVNITTELLELFERSLAEGKAHQAKTTDLLPSCPLSREEEMSNVIMK